MQYRFFCSPGHAIQVQPFQTQTYLQLIDVPEKASDRKARLQAERLAEKENRLETVFILCKSIVLVVIAVMHYKSRSKGKSA